MMAAQTISDAASRRFDAAAERLITGYVGTRFRSIVEPIPLKPKATATQLATGWLGSQQLGNA
jgi:hypothetical protein